MKTCKLFSILAFSGVINTFAAPLNAATEKILPPDNFSCPNSSICNIDTNIYKIDSVVGYNEADGIFHFDHASIDATNNPVISYYYKTISDPKYGDNGTAIIHIIANVGKVMPFVNNNDDSGWISNLSGYYCVGGANACGWQYFYTFNK